MSTNEHQDPHAHDAQKLDDYSRRDVLRRLSLGAVGLPLGAHLLGGAAFQDGATQGTVAAPQGDGRKTKLGVGLRKLGRTGIMVPEVAVGCGRISGSNIRIVEEALASGLSFIDTAPAYVGGQSEIAVGKLLKAQKSKRDKIILSTKASRMRHNTQLSDEQVEKAIRGHLENSLRALQTDYVDIYFAHHGASNPRVIDYDQQWKVIEKLKKEGKIRAVALSTHTNFAAVSEKVIECGKYDVLMTIITAATMDDAIRETTKPKRNKELDELRQRFRGRRRRRGGMQNGMPDMQKIAAGCKKKGIGLIAMKAANTRFFPAGSWKGAVKKFGTELGKFSDHQVLYHQALSTDIASVNVGMSQMSYLDEALDLAEALTKSRAAKKAKAVKKKKV